MFRRIETKNPDRAGVSPLEAFTDLQERGLTCPVRAEQGSDLAHLCVKVDPFERVDSSKTASYCADIDDRTVGHACNYKANAASVEAKLTESSGAVMGFTSSV